MKRILALTLSAAMALSLLCACSDRGAETTVIPSDPVEESESVPTIALPTPTPEPSAEPSAEPSVEPTAEPSQTPSQAPATPAPSAKPTPKPTPKPAPTPKPTPAPTPAPTPTPEPTPAPAAGVDLAAFYQSVTSQNEFGFLELATSEYLDNLYPGMTGIETEQCLVYICAMSMNNGEFGLVQVKNSADVAAVKAIFQARVNYMVGDGNGPGGAQYPMAMDQWENNSRIVSNGDYVMMVVHENCDAIVSQFNALF